MEVSYLRVALHFKISTVDWTSNEKLNVKLGHSNFWPWKLSVDKGVVFDKEEVIVY